jgi:hypothetical protein
MYLVRIYHTNKDKQNESVASFETALSLIGKKETVSFTEQTTI